MPTPTGPHEEVLFHCAAAFATGTAPAVSGRRWFRDPARNDIQAELESQGWPPGHTHVLRSAGDKAARRTGGILSSTLALVTSLLLNENNVGGADTEPEEPANEVDDFPVMWAAPGALARSLPWQLDPARRAEGYSTDLVVTTHRLLFLGTEIRTDLRTERRTDLGVLEHAEVLAEFPAEVLTDARQMRFSPLEADVRLTFADGSWVRLFAGTGNSAERLAQMLAGTVRMLPPSALTSGQRKEADRFCSGSRRHQPYPPTYALLPSGTVLMEVRSPAKHATGFFDVSFNLMTETGERTGPQPGDPHIA
ncbi:hypothetical protein ABZS76_04325 [Streptomyces sp. NPDC005562]|uniref:hypothetical protein n=1 Tax=Streptomyces sp. NPDC005562 TaxID=3154890 RepID=UPI0033A08772